VAKADKAWEVRVADKAWEVRVADKVKEGVREEGKSQD